MKKVLLVLLCAGLLVACNNKNKQEEQVADTVAVEVAEEPVKEEAVVAEEPAQEQAAPAKQTSKPKQTVKEHAQSAAENVANTAIDQGEQQATNQVVNTGKKRR